MNVRWTNYLWDEPRKIDQSKLKNIELKYRITFPKSYVELIADHQGQIPDNYTIKVGTGRATVGEFFFFLDSDEYESSSIEKNISYFEDDIPDNIIPFQSAGGGNAFAFDIRGDKLKPKIIFIDSDYEGEEALLPVANNFEEFVESWVHE